VIGGVLNITDNIKLAQGSSTQTTGVGRIYLYGGTINASALRDPADGIWGNPQMDITEGTLILTGDDVSIVNEYINRGWIIGHDGLGRVTATYNADTDQTIVTAKMADPNLAWNPSPSDFSTVEWTSTGPTLSWRPGNNAVSHDVYFGTDWDDVNNATPSSDEFKINQDPCSYPIGTLDLSTTYYWRIDEVNNNAWAPAGSPWKGTVWRFTMGDYLTVDNMESYGAVDTPGSPPPAGSRIWYTWKDGAGWTIPPPKVEGNGSGAVVDLGSDIVHEGTQSLVYYYANDGTNVLGHNKAYYSEIRADTSYLVIGRDWTKQNVKALELWFYGDPNNDANATEQMYVKLNGVRINYDDDMDDIREASWHQWIIDLAGFGTTLTNVTEIAIGFGNQANMTPGGSGRVFFDDIRLYRSRCIPERRQPVGDLNDDCNVDYDDLEVMTDAWLESDYTGVGNDGLLMNFPDDDSQWVDDAERGRCLWFDGVDDWVDINDSEFSNFHNKTIAFWVNIRQFLTESDPYIFCFRDDDDIPQPYRIYFRTHGPNNVRMQFIGSTAEDYSADYSDVSAGTWHHLAFVLRDTGSDTCTGEFYGDGTLIHEFTNRPRHSGAARSVCLASWNEGNAPYLAASYDDFRVYDAALSADNIKYLAEVPGGVAPTANMMLHYKFDETSGQTAANSSTYAFNRPLFSDAELYEAEPPGSRSVNLRDFAVLADSWLQEQLWP
jgi:hypothetical protein